VPGPGPVRVQPLDTWRTLGRHPGYQLRDPAGQFEQILRAERGTTRGGFHERIRRHRISPLSRQRKQFAVHAIDVDQVVTIVPATLDELQLATEQRMEPVRHPNPRRIRRIIRIMRI